MARIDEERLFLAYALKHGLLSEVEATEVLRLAAASRDRGLQAVRDASIKRRFLPERVAFQIAQKVAQKMREVPDGLRALGGYEIVERIGAGAVGVVFKARQVSVDRLVALKVLPPRFSDDAHYADRFVREARAAARLNHPNIVQALDVGFADGLYYFAMELVEGANVRELLGRQGRIDEREALKICYFVAKGLAHAHAAGLVHRDVKPANILVTNDGRVKLADLGLARDLRFEAADPYGDARRCVGTAYYLAPEQCLGAEADRRTDIYALGATLFHMLAGRPAYDGETPAGIMAQHVHAPIPDPRTFGAPISEPVCRVLRRMMAKRPEDRYQDCAALMADLKPLARGEVPSSGGWVVPPSVVSGRRSAAQAAPAGAPVPAVPSPRANGNGHGGGHGHGPGPGLGLAAGAPYASASRAELDALAAGLPVLPRKPGARAASGGGPDSVGGGAASVALLRPLSQATIDALKDERRRLKPAGLPVSLKYRRRSGQGAAIAVIGVVAAMIGVAMLFVVTSASRTATGDAGGARKPAPTARGAAAGPAAASRSSSGDAEAERLRQQYAQAKRDAAVKARVDEALARAQAERDAREVAERAARLAEDRRKAADLAAKGHYDEAARALEAALAYLPRHEQGELRAEIAELERASDRARRDKVADAVRAAESDKDRLRAALLGMRERVAAGRTRDAVELLALALGELEIESTRLSARVHLLSLRHVEELEGLFKVSVGRLVGKTETFKLRRGGQVEGEVAGVAPGDRLVLRVQKGQGTVEVPIGDLADDEVLRVARLAYGAKNPQLALKHGLKLVYGGRIDEGVVFLRAALDAGVLEATDMLARADELRAVFPPPPPSPAPEGPVVAGGSDPATGDAGGADSKPGKPGGTGTQGRDQTPAEAQAYELDREQTQRIFEGDLNSFAGDGRVSLYYGFIDDRKAVGNDWETLGEPLRFDSGRQAVKAEGAPRRLLHKAHFRGPLKIQFAFEVDFGLDPRRSAISLLIDDAAEAGSGIECFFGLSILQRKRARPVNQAGILDAAEAASKHFRSGTRYTLVLTLEQDGAVTAVLDGERKAMLPGVPVDGLHRASIYLGHVNIQLRSIIVEGKLDAAWASREYQRIRGTRTIGPAAR